VGGTFANALVLRSRPSRNNPAELCIARSDLFELAADVRRGREPPLLLLVGTLVWGFGTTVYLRNRRVSAMLANRARARQCANGIFNTVVAQGAVPGFRALFASGTRLPQLGYAFGTKFLYFAGFNMWPAAPPLILDRRVRIALHKACPNAFANSYPAARSSGYYQHYLAVASNWAARYRLGGADAVELLLFTHGALPRAC